jgi:predicted metal-dependent hydrolase
MTNIPDSVNRIIRSRRSTIALIVVRDCSVTVRAPMKMSGKLIEEFVEKHAKWVQKKQKEIRARVPEQPRQYRAGEIFLYLGQAYPLEIVRDTNKQLVLQGSFKLANSAQGNAESLFRNWYRKQAVKIIGERVALFAEQSQLHVEKIRITSARTRWGSCSSKGTLSFSWRLIMASQAVIDYVIIHELAHIVHHNHSKRFWNLVEKWMPDYKERRNQLRQYGQEDL